MSKKYFSDEPICKECNTTMDWVYEYEPRCGPTDYIFWCPVCGTLVSYSEDMSDPMPEEDDWMVPGT